MLVCGERRYSDGSTHYGWLRSTALLSWLPSFFHRHLPSQSPPSPPSICLSAVNSSPHLHSPQTLPPRPCTFQVTLVPGMYDCGKDRLLPIPFRPPQISCFTLSLKCFSSDSDKCPDVGTGPRLQFPHPLRAGPVLLTLLFFPLVPSSYWVLRGSLYSFLQVRSSCLLSAGILHARLCLKVCSWCSRGERCTPCPPTPPPSCSLACLKLLTFYLCVLI